MIDHSSEGKTARFLVRSSRIRKILERGEDAGRYLDGVYREAIEISGTHVIGEPMIVPYPPYDWQHHYALGVSHLICATYSGNNLVRVDFSSCNPSTPWNEIARYLERRLSYGRAGRTVKTEILDPLM